MELYGIVQNYLELYGIICGTIWNYMELYGIIWINTTLHKTLDEKENYNV